MTKNTLGRYNAWSLALHWLVAILIVLVYAAINLRGYFPKGSDPRALLKTMHFMLGLAILVLAGIRLGVRLSVSSPEITPVPGAGQKLMAIFAHTMLYIFMVVMPMLGWLMLSAAGKPIPFFGLYLPPLLMENKELGKTIKEVHEIIGTFGYFLISFHVGAALFHHYILRDNALRRMLPSYK